ncbi:MAG: Mrp/NBP35 family ATP-binding protein [Candidatus Lambdaproteobacteria bacterium]|nr:Mrp/NBP35 family ATP-binding protein [Candidatus Lambdaproteobacteria bacterium]
MATLEEQFEQALTEIRFDESGRNILDAEIVTECVVHGDSVALTLDLPPGTKQRSTLPSQVKARLEKIQGIKSVSVRLADEAHAAPAGHGHGSHAGHAHAGHAHAAPQAPAPGTPRAPQRPNRQLYLDNYDAVIAIASGKGGVGKSTVAVNLAVSLQRMGHKVSLFDADIYGPSLPIMLGLRNTKPKLEGNNIVPMEKYGLSLMSIGNLVEEAAATIWRGPIVHQVIEQLLRDTRWPGGDFMIIDMPPGTGDAQLTISQLTELAGAVIVSTPQDVALLDALKGIAMFEKVDVPVLGLVENMSAFICPNCGHETAIFDKGNAHKAAGQHNIPFLGRVPIELGIREGGDLGAPVAAGDENAPAARAFRQIAEAMLKSLEQH